jgi:hypothetical protein
MAAISLGPNLAAAPLAEANSRSAAMVTVRCDSEKDKIAGGGFNQVRQLADERTGRAASEFTKPRHVRNRIGRMFLALHGSDGI